MKVGIGGGKSFASRLILLLITVCDVKFR